MADKISSFDKNLLAERITIRKKVKDATDRVTEKLGDLGYWVNDDIRP